MGTSVTEAEAAGKSTTTVAQQHQTKVTLIGKVIASEYPRRHLVYFFHQGHS